MLEARTLPRRRHQKTLWITTAVVTLFVSAGNLPAAVLILWVPLNQQTSKEHQIDAALRPATSAASLLQSQPSASPVATAAIQQLDRGVDAEGTPLSQATIPQQHPAAELVGPPMPPHELLDHARVVETESVEEKAGIDEEYRLFLEALDMAACEDSAAVAAQDQVDASNGDAAIVESNDSLLESVDDIAADTDLFGDSCDETSAATRPETVSVDEEVDAEVVDAEEVDAEVVDAEVVDAEDVHAEDLYTDDPYDESYFGDDEYDYEDPTEAYGGEYDSTADVESAVEESLVETEDNDSYEDDYGYGYDDEYEQEYGYSDEPGAVDTDSNYEAEDTESADDDESGYEDEDYSYENEYEEEYGYEYEYEGEYTEDYGYEDYDGGDAEDDASDAPHNVEEADVDGRPALALAAPVLIRTANTLESVSRWLSGVSARITQIAEPADAQAAAATDERLR